MASSFPLDGLEFPQGGRGVGGEGVPEMDALGLIFLILIFSLLIGLSAGIIIAWCLIIIHSRTNHMRDLRQRSRERRRRRRRKSTRRRIPPQQLRLPPPPISERITSEMNASSIATPVVDEEIEESFSRIKPKQMSFKTPKSVTITTPEEEAAVCRRQSLPISVI